MCSFARSIRKAALVLGCTALVASVLPIGSAYAQQAIVVLGDSNASGAGVGRANAFPAQLDAILHARGHDLRVINAGLGGDTFEGMHARLDASVPPGTRLVIVQGGYNDVVARTPPDMIVVSIDGILSRLHARGIKAVLCGFFYPDWDAVGRSLSRRHRAIFVSGSTCYAPDHRGPDGLHMAVSGHQVVASRLAPIVEQALFGRAGTAAYSRRHRIQQSSQRARWQ